MEEMIISLFPKRTKKEIAKITNLSINQIEWILRKNNITKYESKKYTEDEIIFIKENYPTKGSKYCAEKLNRSENALNKKIKKMGLTINWKYEYIDGNGYIINCSDRNNKYRVHRKIMEKYLGRKLTDKEIVHHIDGNKQNNDLTNLKIMSREEHIAVHKKDLLECRYKI